MVTLTASLAIDSRGVAYVADGALQRISPQGQSTVIRTGLASPQWVAVGPDDTLYVAGSQQYVDPHGPSLVVRITRDGRQTRLGLAPNIPLGLTVDRQGAVYFIDALSEHLLRVGPDGHTETVGPLAGAPTALTIDRQGALYVVDYTDYRYIDTLGLLGARADSTRILRLTPDGRQTVVLNGGLHNPSALAVDNTGALYILDVADTGTATRLLRLPPGGGTPQVIRGMSAVAGFTVDSMGTLYMVVTDPYGTLVKVYGDGRRETMSLPRGFYILGGNALAIDSHGVLYIAERDRVIEIAPGGHQVVVRVPLFYVIEALGRATPVH